MSTLEHMLEVQVEQRCWWLAVLPLPDPDWLHRSTCKSVRHCVFYLYRGEKGRLFDGQ